MDSNVKKITDKILAGDDTWTQDLQDSWDCIKNTPDVKLIHLLLQPGATAPVAANAAANAAAAEELVEEPEEGSSRRKGRKKDAEEAAE